MQIEETKETIYTRDQPIWWHPKKKPEPVPGFFVVYRKYKVIIDVLMDTGDKRRQVAYASELQPREER